MAIESSESHAQNGSETLSTATHNINLILLSVLVVIIVGCNPDTGAWQEARSEDTIEAYEAFLNSYPDSEHNAEARARLSNLEIAKESEAWETAELDGTINALQAFLAAFPNGQNASEANRMLVTHQENAEFEAFKAEVSPIHMDIYQVSDVLPIATLVKKEGQLVGVAIQPGLDVLANQPRRRPESIRFMSDRDILVRLKDQSKFIVEIYSKQPIPINLYVYPPSFAHNLMMPLQEGRNIFITKGEYSVVVVDATNYEKVGRLTYLIEDIGVVTWNSETESPVSYGISFSVMTKKDN